MKNDETGEFELVLGNRQLLSGFFIVVILFAVFFVMGYIVGRNSAPLPQTAANRDQSSGVSPAGRPQSSAPPVAQAPPPAETTKEDSAGASLSRPSSAEQPAPSAETKSEPAAETVASAPAEPAPGDIYLQVAAVKPPAAETTSRTLKKQGFQTMLSPAPGGIMRVWVGPYTDRGKLGEAKAKLEQLGFGPIVVRPPK